MLYQNDPIPRVSMYSSDNTKVYTVLPTTDIVGGSYCQTNLEMLLQPLLVTLTKPEQFFDYSSTAKKHHETVSQHFSIEISKLSFKIT